jgi:hypothetical protein
VRRAIFGILLAALVAGSLDLAFAFWYFGQRGRSPEWILQSIAAGWLGAPAFSGGTNAAALGAASHYAILAVAAGLFLVACRTSRAIAAHPLIAGALYGVCIYAVMQFVVIPLSAFPYRPARAWRGVLTMLAVHVLLVGIPLAAIVRNVALTRPSRSSTRR